MITGESAAPGSACGDQGAYPGAPEVDSVINLITLQWGEQLMVAVQAKMRAASIGPRAGRRHQSRSKKVSSTRWPQATWCFFEPDFAPGD